MEGTMQWQRRKSVTRQGASTSTSVSSSTAPTPAAPAKKTLEWLIGRRIKVKTAVNEDVEGIIYAYDRVRQERKGISFRVIKLSHIKEILSVTSEDVQEEPLTNVLPVSHVYLDQLRAREADTLKSLRQQMAKMGVGVTKEAQEIFDALSKTLPCRWSNETIVVLDEVLIPPPYDVEGCKANASSSASLARVRKVLEGERRRLANAKK
ncbi:hypothetical protein DFQ28_011205 [Apophysomyces sp. BC1034]|nr:hypothetical protein DFQ30_011046 [Apophysomyces sp. BC1015]KAG0169417.1 hypothetical protein DFQ29_009688 [Apophysomyces sp. BC1021]KAG0184396.1 hypothetical protein DFQ28_011205 [Apophysomyces sp. BC1034]